MLSLSGDTSRSSLEKVAFGHQLLRDVYDFDSVKDTLSKRNVTNEDVKTGTFRMCLLWFVAAFDLV